MLHFPITFKKTFFFQLNMYFLTVIVTDKKTNLKKDIFVQIFVIDVNDNAPVFNPSEIILSVNENSKIGSLIGVLKATDADILDTDRIKYNLINSPNFIRLNQKTGFMTVAADIDREQVKIFYCLLSQTFLKV